METDGADIAPPSGCSVGAASTRLVEIPKHGEILLLLQVGRPKNGDLPKIEITVRTSRDYLAMSAKTATSP